MKGLLSPKELAEVIEASESSIKRWVDDGVIEAEKTGGGHRRIAIDVAIRFIRERQLNIQRGDLLGMPDIDSLLNGETVEHDPVSSLFDYLFTGHAEKVRGLILLLYLRGYALAEICDDIIRAAMEQIGELWKSRDDGVFVEHRATEICAQALHMIQSFVPPKPGSPMALGGAISGDIYQLPTISACTILRSEGWHAINLGPNTPFDAMLSAILVYKPVLFWVSVSVCSNVNAFAKGIEQFADDAAAHGSKVIVGGKAHRHAKKVKHSNLYVGKSMAELVAFARGLTEK